MSTALLRNALSQNVCRVCQRAILPTAAVRHNSNRASVTRINRNLYARTYPTMLVMPDGATMTVRYKEPRKIILLPVDPSTLADDARIARQLRRKPKQKIIIQEEIEDTYDGSQYAKLFKK